MAESKEDKGINSVDTGMPEDIFVDTGLLTVNIELKAEPYSLTRPGWHESSLLLLKLNLSGSWALA